MSLLFQNDLRFSDECDVYSDGEECFTGAHNNNFPIQIQGLEDTFFQAV